MFIIWGTRPSKKHFGTTSVVFSCEKCNNTSYFNISAYKNWFTLYFIPIFPLSIERRIECPICEYGYSLGKKDFDRILKYENL